MATGYTLQEVEEKKPDGFFPKLFQNVCTQMGDANVDKMHELQNDPMGIMRYNFEKKIQWNKFQEIFFWSLEFLQWINFTKFVTNVFVMFFRFSYELDAFRKNLEVKEFYPEKNPHECKIKKDYGNKAYQDGKDIDALHFYTQVSIQMEYIHI